MTLLIQWSFQADHYELERVRCVGANIIRHLGDIGVVQSSIHLVEDEEGSWLITKPESINHRTWNDGISPMDGKKKSQGRYCFLPAWKLFHVSEPLHRRHGVVFDTTVIRFLGDNVKCWWLKRKKDLPRYPLNLDMQHRPLGLPFLSSVLCRLHLSGLKCDYRLY